MRCSTRRYLALALVGAFLSFSGACKSKDKPSKNDPPPAQSNLQSDTSLREVLHDASPDETQAHWYLATLHSSELGVKVPFYLALPPGGVQSNAVILQGTEATKLPIVWTDANHFEIDFGLFQSSIRASVDEAGNLSGTWEQDSVAWGASEFLLKGDAVDEPDNAKLFAPPEGAAFAPTEASGVWKVDMSDSGTAKLVLATENGAAHGTLYFASGNIIALAGHAANGKLRLAGFDGTSAYLFTANLDPDKGLSEGSWLAGAKLSWQESFTGERTEPFELETGPQVTTPKKGIEVAGINFDAYKGKPTIIEMAGSWCITCRFAAPFLREVYADYHPKGLEMVTLSYEFTDDPKYNQQRARDFKREYALDWEVIPVTGGPERFSEIMPKGLAEVDVSGFPISIFVGRDGEVKHVHAGFPGSKEGEMYETVTREYRAKVEQLLAP